MRTPGRRYARRTFRKELRNADAWRRLGQGWPSYREEAFAFRVAAVERALICAETVRLHTSIARSLAQLRERACR